jgi:regulation of enolase protein 1 (concanavalin A-like superfamily)
VGEPVTLRFEVTGDRVDALCSLDREQWFSVGHATFPVDKEAQVGVHAIGMIDRTIYHGAYPEGTAIRFTAFNLWGT